MKLVGSGRRAGDVAKTWVILKSDKLPDDTFFSLCETNCA